jgi:hypothetical protein
MEAPRLGAPLGEEPSPSNLPREESSLASSALEEPSLGNSPEPHNEIAAADAAKVQQPVYFISTVLCDARKCSTMQQKLLCMLLILQGSYATTSRVIQLR